MILDVGVLVILVSQLQHYGEERPKSRNRMGGRKVGGRRRGGGGVGGGEGGGGVGRRRG